MGQIQSSVISDSQFAELVQDYEQKLIQSDGLYMIQETDHREYESNTSENSKSSPQLIES